MKKELVSVIIVNWNGVEHLKKCLPSLYAQSYKNIEVILVDNGSEDGSVEWAKGNYSKIKIVVNKKNLGFAEGNNLGFNIARGEYVLFLNNDTIVSKNFLIELLRVMKGDKKIGGVQSKILFMDNHSQLDSVGSFLTYTGFLYHIGVYAPDSQEFNKQKIIFSAKGACMMFKRKVLDEIKVDGEIFDSRFFAYFEESDMCHRIWLAGYKIAFVPKSVIYHKFGATSIKLLKPFVEYHSYKNRINSYIKNLGVGMLFRILPLHFAICEVLSLIFLFRGKWQISLVIQKAIWWNIKNIRPTIKKRIVVQEQIRKVRDNIIFWRLVFNPSLKYYLSQLIGWNVTQITNTNVEE